MAFQLLCKHDLRQETVHDFIAFTVDGNCISLLGSKTELVTLELSSKSTRQLPFPYVAASWTCANKQRPLDKLAAQANLQNIYESSNVLEMQELSLESVYTAVCSQDVPVPNRMAAKLAPQPLPDGQMLLATLNSYGALHLLSKNPELPFWRPYEKGLDIAATLRDTLQPPYEVPVAKMKSFRHFQPYMDRSWITMLAWRPTDNGSYVLILGTAAGSIWTLTLCKDAATLQSHAELQTMMGHICYFHTYEHLLLVGDNNGLVHLYKFSAEEDGELCLVKTLWLRPDRMGLQQAVITYCPDRSCYYIACCKAAHLLIWCMPKKDTGSWLETRLLVGGIKITGICALASNNYALVTAHGDLYNIELSHKAGQLVARKQHIDIKDMENDLPVGLCCSPNKNLLTIMFTRNKECVHNKTVRRNLLQMRVGRLHEGTALPQLARALSPSTSMNSCLDLLVEVRLNIFQGIKLNEYVNYAPFETFAFDSEATEAQLQRLQIKYHVLDTIILAQKDQRNQSLLKRTGNEMQLVLDMLALTHMRLRLQFLLSLKELTLFQRQAAHCQLAASARIRQKLQQQLLQENAQETALNAVIKRFLSQMGVHFERLQLKLNLPEVTIDEVEQLCTVSYVQLEPSLERHFCTLCDRLALLDRQLLEELYAPGCPLLCPCCHGTYALEVLDAQT